ncbi:hypothetical protein GNI_039150 [Gregarina niphandrodes]|uniref:Uncharacterized protein n=1 Tax=Gregarina niphandrodes TaxID=110365 RepID=A0A023BAF1_GRENI|nr:hypothetical protein GNI_039150 [Gregarina niphandrodes]EZG78248.1 hypothetical protein GNI_039150 [Gregarina niphandrodes]|eukprot:XP_011129380.1 hypothetical protein GNI_039150 [Gregarina niphandrodes]
MEAAQRVATQREAVQREAVLREAAQREAAHQEGVQRGAVQREAAQKEAAQRDAAQREAVQREVARREAVRREAVRREAVQREALQREAFQREAVQREAAQREAQRDAVQREVVQREAAHREAVQREAAHWEGVQREAAHGEAAQPDGAQREAALREAHRQTVQRDREAVQRETAYGGSSLGSVDAWSTKSAPPPRLLHAAYIRTPTPPPMRPGAGGTLGSHTRSQPIPQLPARAPAVTSFMTTSFPQPARTSPGPPGIYANPVTGRGNVTDTSMVGTLMVGSTTSTAGTPGPVASTPSSMAGTRIPVGSSASRYIPSRTRLSPSTLGSSHHVPSSLRTASQMRSVSPARWDVPGRPFATQSNLHWAKTDVLAAPRPAPTTTGFQSTGLPGYQQSFGYQQPTGYPHRGHLPTAYVTTSHRRTHSLVQARPSPFHRFHLKPAAVPGPAPTPTHANPLYQRANVLQAPAARSAIPTTISHTRSELNGPTFFSV